jgi:uncharacterized OB-fold protein
MKQIKINKNLLEQIEIQKKIIEELNAKISTMEEEIKMLQKTQTKKSYVQICKKCGKLFLFVNPDNCCET